MDIFDSNKQYKEIKHILSKLGFYFSSTTPFELYRYATRYQILYKDTPVGFINEFPFSNEYEISIYYTQEENPEIYRKLCLLGFVSDKTNSRVEYFIHANKNKKDLSNQIK